MGRVAVEILPPLARDEGGTAFRVKDDRILSQDARARIFDVKTASQRGLSELLVGKPFFRFDLQIPRLAPCVSRWNAGLPSSRGARSANSALLSRVRDSVLRARRCGTQSYRPRAGRGRRTARYSRGSWGGGLRRGRRAGTRVCHLHAGRDRFAVTVDARRLLPRMLPSESGLRIPRLARGLLAGVFPRPVGRVGGKFLRAGRLRAANGALGLARRPVLGIAAEGGLSLAVRVAPERGLAVSARNAVGEWCVAVSVQGRRLSLCVTAERGIAVCRSRTGHGWRSVC